MLKKLEKEYFLPPIFIHKSVQKNNRRRRGAFSCAYLQNDFSVNINLFKTIGDVTFRFQNCNTRRRARTTSPHHYKNGPSNHV